MVGGEVRTAFEKTRPCLFNVLLASLVSWIWVELEKRSLTEHSVMSSEPEYVGLSICKVGVAIADDSHGRIVVDSGIV